MEQHRQAPAVGFLIHREHPGVVDEELLKIRVDLDALQAPGLDVVHLPLDVLHVLVPGSQADELGVLLTLLLNELVDGPDLLHLGGHGAHQEPVNPGLSPSLGQHVGQPHVLHGDAVEVPHRGGGLLRDLSRIDMGVGVGGPVRHALVLYWHQSSSPFFPCCFWRSRSSRE